ncbi:MAG: branched-chain amino acid ABC transporter permease [Deltaproteobacteria bacterium]|nr:branched-chain amino acid ABC transporter permease [Deltaproteobacteria bacterium]
MDFLIQFAQQLSNGTVIGVIYALMAIGLTIAFGIMNVGNFAQGEFYMLGAVATFFLVSLLKLNYFMSLLISGIIIFALGVIVEFLTIKPLQLRGFMPVILSTLGLSVFFQHLALILWGPVPRSIPAPLSKKPFCFFEIYITPQRVLVLVGGVLIIAALYLLIKKTKVGMAMRAVAKDSNTASLMGINIRRIYLFSFGLSCALAALAGGLIGPLYTISPMMGEVPVIKAFSVVIMGGMGNVQGAIVAGFILGVVESLGAGFISTSYKDAIAFGIMILVLLFRPQGIFGKQGLR